MIFIFSLTLHLFFLSSLDGSTCPFPLLLLVYPSLGQVEVPVAEGERKRAMYCPSDSE